MFPWSTPTPIELRCDARVHQAVASEDRRCAARLTIPTSDLLTSCSVPTWVLRMNLAEDEHAFLRDLVKTSRQKPHHVRWIDRDGTDRQTALSQAEASRLKAIAQRLKVSLGDVLRQAAHIPLAK